jgi:hypothetical protein
MSDFDPAETIVSAGMLARALETTSSQIYELTRLGILHPVELDVDSTDCSYRYEFLDSLRAYLRHFRAQVHKEN